jgi:hypothetical protein
MRSCTPGIMRIVTTTISRLRYTALQMTPELFKEIIATYQRHGWELKRVLIRPATRADLREQAAGLFDEAKLIESEFDGLWFARPSQAGREAWELRLVAEQPYALFEAFEADETEAEREEARLEMENKMRAQVGQS